MKLIIVDRQNSVRKVQGNIIKVDLSNNLTFRDETVLDEQDLAQGLTYYPSSILESGQVDRGYTYYVSAPGRSLDEDEHYLLRMVDAVYLDNEEGRRLANLRIARNYRVETNRLKNLQQKAKGQLYNSQVAIEENNL